MSPNAYFVRKTYNLNQEHFIKGYFQTISGSIKTEKTACFHNNLLIS